MKHTRFFAALLCILMVHIIPADASPKKSNPFRILVSTYPIYMITRNVVKDTPGISLKLMIPGTMGCPHDYGLTPQDMKKITETDVFVVNGLGMEEFLGKSLTKTNPGMTVIDSSKGIRETLAYTKPDEEEHEKHHEGEEHDHGHHHHDSHTVNPHLFASPGMAALLAVNISKGLGKANPVNARRYEANAEFYAKKLNSLARQFQDSGKKLSNNRIVTQHGVFDYLAKDMGLSVVAVISAHAGHELSANDLLHVVSVIKKEKPGAIFIEPQYPVKEGKAISAETGVPLSSLDPVASGPDNAPLDYYENMMKKNLETLVRVLGKKKSN